MLTPKPPGEPWTPDEAQQHLPQILRLAETDGIQRIKTADSIITITAHPLRHPNTPDGLTLGQALVKYMPRGNPPLPIPERGAPCACHHCQPARYEADAE